MITFFFNNKLLKSALLKIYEALLEFIQMQTQN